MCVSVAFSNVVYTPEQQFSDGGETADELADVGAGDGSRISGEL